LVLAAGIAAAAVLGLRVDKAVLAVLPVAMGDQPQRAADLILAAQPELPAALAAVMAAAAARAALADAAVAGSAGSAGERPLRQRSLRRQIPRRFLRSRVCDTLSREQYRLEVDAAAGGAAGSAAALAAETMPVVEIRAAEFRERSRRLHQ
jgi:hypothetical protein